MMMVTDPAGFRFAPRLKWPAFARALGECGATLMPAGSIPEETLPLALYAAIQATKDREAWNYALVLFIIGFVILSSVGAYQYRRTDASNASERVVSLIISDMRGKSRTW